MSRRASIERENILCLNIIKGRFKSDCRPDDEANSGFLNGVFPGGFTTEHIPFADSVKPLLRKKQSPDG